jgi:hypothetical protein
MHWLTKFEKTKIQSNVLLSKQTLLRVNLIYKQVRYNVYWVEV